MDRAAGRILAIRRLPTGGIKVFRPLTFEHRRRRHESSPGPPLPLSGSRLHLGARASRHTLQGRRHLCVCVCCAMTYRGAGLAMVIINITMGKWSTMFVLAQVNNAQSRCSHPLNGAACGRAPLGYETSGLSHQDALKCGDDLRSFRRHFGGSIPRLS